MFQHTTNHTKSSSLSLSAWLLASPLCRAYWLRVCELAVEVKVQKGKKNSVGEKTIDVRACNMCKGEIKEVGLMCEATDTFLEGV